MIYALLTTISAAHPTAIPIPTPTASPTYFPIEIAKNLTDLPWGWEIIGVLASILLGGAAVFISYNAYSFAKRQQKREEEMRQQEAKVSVIEQMFTIYNFFNSRISDEDYFTFSDEKTIMARLDEIDGIENLAKLIFVQETFEKIALETGRIGLCFDKGVLPQIKNIATEYKTNDDISKDFEGQPLACKLSPIEQMQRKVNLIKVVRKNMDTAFQKYRLNL